MSKTAYKREAPGNWISIQEYEQRRDLEAGEVTTQRGQVPTAWINPMTRRVVYRESPFSTIISHGELDKSNYQITEKNTYKLKDNLASPKEVVEKMFDYMEHDNGMTPVDVLLSK